MNKHKLDIGDRDTDPKRFCVERNNVERDRRNPKDISIDTKKVVKAKLKDQKQGKNPQGGSAGDEKHDPQCKTPSCIDASNRSIVTSSPSINTFAPKGINVHQYAEARAYEIKNLKHALKEAKYSKNSRAFQQLPRHMRRRAASHNIKRVPKRLRAKATKEMEKDLTKKKKPDSRRYKRKPKNLLQEYSRRSRIHGWLETHIWHAKRFKMVEKWGYKLAQQPCDKSFRATYRASSKSCLMQDKSYMEFIELTGREEDIISKLTRMTSTHSGTQLNNKLCLSGSCYGQTIFYHHDRYPYRAIGPIKFIWGPIVGMDKRNLIIINHPSISKELVMEFKFLFDANETIKPSKAEECIDRKQEMEGDAFASSDKSQKLGGSNNENTSTSEDVCALTMHATDGSFSMTHHKLDFVMFSLTGPLSYSVLQKVLIFPEHEKTNETDSDQSSSEIAKKSYLSNQSWCHTSYESIQEENNKIYNLYVEDPRFHIPYKKQNPFKNIASGLKKIVGETWCNDSSLLWNTDVRQNVKDEKLTNQKINDIRSQMLVPGKQLPFKSLEIPIVVLPHQGCDLPTELQGCSKSYGEGFDVILPSGWAMPFWIALIFQGARAGGLSEEEGICLESMRICFPRNFPDTEAGLIDAENMKREKEENQSRYPPGKRMNYDILGVANPFFLPWQDIISQWITNIKLLLPDGKCVLENISSGQKDFYVLRDSAFLNQLNAVFNGKLLLDDKIDVMKKMLNRQNSLIAVRVYSMHRNSPENNAILYIPMRQDFIDLAGRNCGECKDEYYGPMEPKHKGLKHLFPYCFKFHNILRHNVRHIGINTRWVLGYVQSGRYSLARGKGAGVGYISMVGLYYLLSINEDVSQLLFRNTNSFQYRFCDFEVISDGEIF